MAMKLKFFCISLLLINHFTCGQSLEVPITEKEAEILVAEQEQEKEAAKDAKEIELQAAEIIETAVADLGFKKVIFNRVKNAPENTAPQESETIQVDSTLTSEEIEAALAAHIATEAKPMVSLTLFGEVDEEGISELWWEHEGSRYRIFTNANFLYFTGHGLFEDLDKRYSVFMLVTSSETISVSENWEPTLDDFTSDALEYFIVEWGDAAEPSEAAFTGIEAMLSQYAESASEMQMAYENRVQIQQARKAYLEANPPKERDVIINFRPTGKSATFYQQ